MRLLVQNWMLPSVTIFVFPMPFVCEYLHKRQAKKESSVTYVSYMLSEDIVFLPCVEVGEKQEGDDFLGICLGVSAGVYP